MISPQSSLARHPKILALAFLAALAAVGPAAATTSRNPVAHLFGLGVVFGDPTGVSGKYWMSETTAVDGVVGWDVGEDDEFKFQVDYLYHIPLVVPDIQGHLPFYIGIGGRARLSDDERDRAGVRIPVGLSYIFDPAPLEVFVELAPVLDLISETSGSMEGGIGVRFYFK